MLCIAGKNLIASKVLAAHPEAVCIPDGEEDWQPSLRKAALGLGVQIVALEDLYDVEDLCFLSLEYSRIIRPERFKSKRLFNVHFSLLPKYRGCYTSIWPILNGEKEHGVTLHVIDAGIDTGPIIDQRSFPLGDMTAFDAYMRCQHLGAKLALDWIPKLGDCPSRPQGEGTTYPRKAMDFGLKELDLSQSTQQVMQRFRAFYFPVYQFPTLNGREIRELTVGKVEGWDTFPTADGLVSVRWQSARERDTEPAERSVA